MQGEDFYTVEEAARALKLTPDRIRQMLRDGELEGVPLREGGPSGWKVPVRVIHGGDHPPPIEFSESPTPGPESRLSEPEDISGPEDIRGEGQSEPTPAQPQRNDDAAENNREPTAPPTHRVTVQEAARILETSVDALLLVAKDESIADLRDRVAFLERQLESRVEEIRRRDHIIAALTERIPPAIEAPNHEKPPRARESTAEGPTKVTSSGAGGLQRGTKRRWWRRVFGG
jgi:excisionase family DNA binding protein